MFYGMDLNPTMDQQAVDRCHGIGRSRAVHIYRLLHCGHRGRKHRAEVPPHANTTAVGAGKLNVADA